MNNEQQREISDKYENPYISAMFTNERRNGILRTSKTKKISTTCEVCCTSPGFHECQICKKLLCTYDVINTNYCHECYHDGKNKHLINAIEYKNPHMGVMGFFYNMWYYFTTRNKSRTITPK